MGLRGLTLFIFPMAFAHSLNFEQAAGFFAHSPKKYIWVKSVYSIDIQIDNGEIRIRGGVMLRIGQNKAKYIWCFGENFISLQMELMTI